MNRAPKNKANGLANFFRKLAKRKQPSFQLEEAQFLIESENFGTGLWRALRMFWEYMMGFYAFKDVTNCVTVFGSARFKPEDTFYQLAEKIGYHLAASGFTVMTGGGPGAMEATNKGAKAANGISIACNIIVSFYERPNRFIDKCIHLRYFFVRKVMLTKYSSAFVFMPGGYGTLDELFEMLTLIQTKKIKGFPLVLVGKAYWEPLVNFISGTLLAHKTILQSDVDRLMITDSPEEAVEYIKTSLTRILNDDAA